MAELTTIGLARNIIQFVDFGVKLFAGSRELYKSATGSTEEGLELEVVTKSLQDLAQSLNTDKSPRLGQAVSKDERELRKLTAECEKLAEKLLQTLKKLKVKDNGNRKWDSFRKALARVMKEKEIKDLEDRLARFRKQISQVLLLMMRYTLL
jgi:hypothetical protein